jgi:hypothetical protein
VYGEKMDMSKNPEQPLFNEEAWNQARQLLMHVDMGCISDHPDIPLYYHIGTDSNGLNIYHCVREGHPHANVHIRN